MPKQSLGARITGSAPFGGVEELRRCAGGDGLLLLLLKPADLGELAAALRRAASAGTARQDGGISAASFLNTEPA